MNLIPGRLRDAAAVRVRTRRWMAFATVYAGALAIACLGLRSFGNHRTSRYEDDGGQLTARVASAEQMLAKLRREVQEHDRRREASETVGVHPDWSLFLAAVAEQRREDIILQLIEIRAADERPPAPKATESGKDGEKAKPRPRPLESYRVTIKGFGLSQSGVLGFITRLEDLGPLVDVQLKESRSEPFRGVAAVAFDAECRLVESAPRQTAAEEAP